MTEKMKTLKFILAGILVMLAIDSNAQIMDYYSSVNYTMGIPLGSTSDYIGQASFRGASFEFGRFMNDDLSVGFLLSWSVFYEGFDTDTYTFDNLILTGKIMKPGVHIPVTPDIYNPVLDELERLEIKCVEKTEPMTS